jgi:5'-nucleotidase
MTIAAGVSNASRYRLPMRILLTNDDGIRAPGIIAMHEALLDPDAKAHGPIGGRDSVVHTVAPLHVQSATGHGVTFHKPLMVSEAQVTPRFGGTAVDGRPADCVKLAVSTLWPDRFGRGTRPDLVISGMNAGANVGVNVIYSGTVAAAIEAAFLGVPSIAVSLHLGKGKPRFDIAAARARHVIDLILKDGLPDRHECLSINIPITEGSGPMPPIRVCPQNAHGLVDLYEKRVSPINETYYWAAGHGLDFHNTDEGTDVDWLMRRCITVTPLHYDLTRHDRLQKWSRRLPEPAEGSRAFMADVPSPLDQGD